MNLPAFRLSKSDLTSFSKAIEKEWLVTNGLGGYASSTVLGVNTRKYHGLLVAALHPPGDRTVFLERIDEEIDVDNTIYRLGANEFQDVFYPEGFRYLEEFEVSPFPQYVYTLDQNRVTKSHIMPYQKNAVMTIYEINNTKNIAIKFRLTPLITCRHFHSVIKRSGKPLRLSQVENNKNEIQLNFESPKAAMVIATTHGKFKSAPNWIDKIFYRQEAARGESSITDSYQPGYFETSVPPNATIEFVVTAAAAASLQQCNEILTDADLSNINPVALSNFQTQRQSAYLESFYATHRFVPESQWLNWILLSADSFVVKGFGSGTSVIAGYHWFEAWGRDTFISLPGLLLTTGRFAEARRVLLDFNKFCTLGLIPNFLSDLSLVPSCNTVDATMWHINAVLQYIKYTGDFDFVQSQLWGSIKEIIEKHISGTSFGIQVDDDGLLTHGPRLTWMDAEVNGDAVTPRGGKAVEIQALWYNALRIVQLLATKLNDKKNAESYALLADKTRDNFKRKFWNDLKNCLFDTLGSAGPDSSIRPNQIIAASLDFQMTEEEQNKQIVDIVQRELLTPVGLRTLEQADPKYKGICQGNRWSRDQAYHNGTVWPWLLGPFVTAYLRNKGFTTENSDYSFRHFLEHLFSKELFSAGLGTISEIYDGDFPHNPRGCISQAWSVAEPLRAYIEDILQVRPPFEKQVLSILAE